MVEKTCGKCGEVKPASEYNPSKTMGLSSYCKPCHKEYMKEYYRKNRESMKASATQYYADNREKRLQQSKDYHSKPENKRRWKCKDLQRRFGVTLDWYEGVLKEQGGGCKICGQTPKQEGRRLAVDHCHDSGMIRGLLCKSCNVVIGHAKDDPQILLSAIKYLNQYNQET